jgi:glycerophosphoryl diester phosphodiesterase
MKNQLQWLTARPIAHRGLHDGNKLVWENTLTAFAGAVKHNYAIECDVHLTEDGVPVVFHDGDLKRLTGKEGQVHSKTSKQMQALKIGGTPDHVPTLRQMLDLVKGKVPLVIELKGDPGSDAGLVKAVADELASYKGQVAIMSFDHHLIRQCPQDAKGIPLGLTAEGLRDQDIEDHFSMLGYGVDFVSYYVHHLPNRFVSFMRDELKKPVISWTIRTLEELEKSSRFADQVTFEGFAPK